MDAYDKSYLSKEERDMVKNEIVFWTNLKKYFKGKLKISDNFLNKAIAECEMKLDHPLDEIRAEAMCLLQQFEKIRKKK